MNICKLIDCSTSIHFIGIGGVSVSALAMHALLDKKKVSGSDSTWSPITEKLKSLGAKVCIGHHSNNVLGADLVVATSAVNSDNPEIVKANELNLPIIKRSEYLGAILSGYDKVIAVAGSHGKTTATAMISDVLIKAGKNPTVFLGGEHYSFGNFRAGSKEIAVVECCEYKRNLLDINADVAVILNVDNDHMDCYADLEDLCAAFSCFSPNGIKIVNSDDNYSKRTCGISSLSFGVINRANFKAEKIKLNDDGCTFNVYAYSRKQSRINLKVKGEHNVYNALAACAVAELFEICPKIVKSALEQYSGVKRRNEYLGMLFDRKVYADYAHHPSEIKAMLSAYKIQEKKTAVIFQPHTYSRTKTLMQDFVNVLKEVDDLIICDTYAAREEYDYSGSAELLSNQIAAAKGNCVFVSDFKQLVDVIKIMNDDIKTILVLGAGDVYNAVKAIIDEER